MTNKRYIKGSWRTIKAKFGDIINISLNLEDLKTLNQTKGYIKLSIMKRKEPDQYWNDLYIVENDYKPKEKKDKLDSTNDEVLPFN